jgi:DNA-binding transcriptional regulator of glucitol operon
MRTLWTPKWLLVHVAAVALVIGFLLLCWWQVNRAANGNLLSFGYAIEWPAFAAFVVWVWVKEMRQAVRAGPAAPNDDASAAKVPELAAASVVRRRQPRNNAAYDDSGDSDLAAYNRYLAWLNANPTAPRSEFPG